MSCLFSAHPILPLTLAAGGAYVQEIGFIILILQMRKQRFREVK